KVAVAIRNLGKATEANRRRLASLPRWRCLLCLKESPATVHQIRKTYCSRRCMARDYQARFRGSANPHFSNADLRICVRCKRKYRSYNKSRRFCTWACYARSEPMKSGGSRKDTNHTAITTALGKMGASVLDISEL